MDTDELGKKLDTLISILRIAYRKEIEAARATIREDKVNASILDLTTDWVTAGQLKASAMQKTKQSKPTVERRVAALVEQGVLEKRGAGGSVSYRASGLI
jgi:hypothetical protein